MMIVGSMPMIPVEHPSYQLILSLGPNPSGIGVYNAEVENYLLQFLLVERSDKLTTTLFHQISMPPGETKEFNRADSLRRGQLNSADSLDSIDSEWAGT
jgi:hypothetical protein